MSPNKTNIARWVLALRSGKYTQGKGMLRMPDGRMCCLGVACDISGKGEWKEIDPEANLGVNHEYLFARGSLPDKVSEWLGLAKTSNPILVDDSYDDISCTRANDTLGWTFQSIAAALTKRYLDGESPEYLVQKSERAKQRRKVKNASKKEV